MELRFEEILDKTIDIFLFDSFYNEMTKKSGLIFSPEIVLKEIMKLEHVNPYTYYQEERILKDKIEFILKKFSIILFKKDIFDFNIRYFSRWGDRQKLIQNVMENSYAEIEYCLLRFHNQPNDISLNNVYNKLQDIMKNLFDRNKLPKYFIFARNYDHNLIFSIQRNLELEQKSIMTSEYELAEYIDKLKRTIEYFVHKSSKIKTKTRHIESFVDILLDSYYSSLSTGIEKIGLHLKSTSKKLIEDIDKSNNLNTWIETHLRISLKGGRRNKLIALIVFLETSPTINDHERIGEPHEFITLVSAAILYEIISETPDIAYLNLNLRAIELYNACNQILKKNVFENRISSCFTRMISIEAMDHSLIEFEINLIPMKLLFSDKTLNLLNQNNHKINLIIKSGFNFHLSVLEYPHTDYMDRISNIYRMSRLIEDLNLEFYFAVLNSEIDPLIWYGEIIDVFQSKSLELSNTLSIEEDQSFDVIFNKIEGICSFKSALPIESMSFEDRKNIIYALIIREYVRHWILEGLLNTITLKDEYSVLIDVISKPIDLVTIMVSELVEQNRNLQNLVLLHAMIEEPINYELRFQILRNFIPLDNILNKLMITFSTLEHGYFVLFETEDLNETIIPFDNVREMVPIDAYEVKDHDVFVNDVKKLILKNSENIDLIEFNDVIKETNKNELIKFFRARSIPFEINF